MILSKKEINDVQYYFRNFRKIEIMNNLGLINELAE